MTTNLRWKRLVYASGVFLLLCLGVFVLPYAIPVSPSVSLSYVVGFSNRTALLAFLVGGFWFVAVVNDAVPASETVTDRPLPWWTLVLTVLATIFACLGWRVHQHGKLGPEANYGLERQWHLDHGQRLYRDFEFIYGPLLIYPGHALEHLFRTSPLHGYFAALIAEWVLGMAMLWFVVAKADIPSRGRYAVLFFLFAWNLMTLQSDGLNYTPFRSFCAASLAVMVYLSWKRYRQAYLSAGLAVASTAFAFLVSPEQAFGLATGVMLYFCLLKWKDRAEFPVGALMLTAGGIAVEVFIAARSGMLLTTLAMGRGGLCFPLLPSSSNAFLLGTYLLGLGWLYRSVRRRHLQQAGVPLALCGIPLLTSALGRCDTGHLASAVPLFVVSILAISGKRSLFWLWLSLAVYLLFPLRFFAETGLRHLHAAGPVQGGGLRLVAAAQDAPHPIPAGKYYAPVFVAMNPDGTPRWSADSGFYFGIWNVVSEEGIAAKVKEIQRKRASELLLQEFADRSLVTTFWDSEENPELLHSLEMAPWIPRRKHALPSLEPIRRVVNQMYVPTEQTQDGFRVWRLRRD